ncbi:hypothetical protein HK097_011458 [Rhizophlyctis rosea]|uniref:SCP domain-containing protein n=1 Tax=Rhizophlyctis rosea TaxID=64517 RepID=A0AAD5S8P8_9FUNG|nr:hypothetical protein HK097_011458 [Rhizophlyctis rosea]
MHSTLLFSLLCLTTVLAAPGPFALKLRQIVNTPTPTPTSTTELSTLTQTGTATSTSSSTSTSTTTEPVQTFIAPPQYAGTPPPTTTLNLALPTNVPRGQNATQRIDCLNAHNEVRRNVSTLSPLQRAPVDLKYDLTLEEASCKWARYLAENKQFKHSYGLVGKYGENLHKISWPSPRTLQQGPQLGSCRSAVRSWAREVIYYKPGYKIGVNGNFAAYGHYTQIVWPSSLNVGCCGWQSLDRRDFVWACEYSPQGNWYGVAAY